MGWISLLFIGAALGWFLEFRIKNCACRLEDKTLLQDIQDEDGTVI